MKNLTPEIVEMPQPLGIFSGELYDRGLEYYEAFKTLASSQPQKSSYVGCFLVVHSLELLLKSYLASKLIEKGNLKSKNFGHNLIKIYQKCEEFRLPNVKDLKKLSDELHRMNEDFDFRYPTGYVLHVPSPRLCIEVIDNLLNVLEPIILQTRLIANVQFASDTRHLRGKKIRWSD
jgi:hypothetical protein